MKTFFLWLCALVVFTLGLGWLGGGLYVGIWRCWVLSVVDLIEQAKLAGQCDSMAIALDLLCFFIAAPLVNTLACYGFAFFCMLGSAIIGYTEHRRRYRYGYR